MTKPAEPKVRVVYKPLVRKGEANGAGTSGGADEAFAQKLRNSRSGNDGAASGVNAAFLRAANEDDDGYDPYSDRKEIRPFFEENPWD